MRTPSSSMTTGVAFSLCIFLLVLLRSASSVKEERALYLVLLEGDTLAGPREHGNAEASQMQVRAESHERLLRSSLVEDSYTKVYSFHHALNGFALHTTPTQAKRLESVEGVMMVEKDRGVKMMTTHTPDFLGLRDQVWPRVGGARNAGQEIVIGFVDTGINPAHPSFAFEPSSHNLTLRSRFFQLCYVAKTFPRGSCNNKIVSAWPFYAGAALVLPPPPPGELSPFDDLGHGSHVASIAAGNDGVPVVVNGFNYGYASGMAPGARIAVYKALYRQGGTLTDVVAAVDQAVRDGVDVLTLAIGPDYPPDEVPVFLNVFEMVLLHARRAGVFVVQAAGNKGPWSSSVIAYSPWSVAVAASSTDREYISTLVLGNVTQLRGVSISGPTYGDELIQYMLVAAKDAVVDNHTTASTAVQECQDETMLRADMVQGSIVICNFSYGFANGSSSITKIVNTARALRFGGFILVANPAFGDLIVEPLPLAVPTIFIPSVADVKILMDYYESHTTRDPRGYAIYYRGVASITEGRVASYGGRPVVARFSSRGPDIRTKYGTPADVLKPDVLAPGVQIWGAWSPISAGNPILEGHNFALISGTSMATPHIAGIAAIIKQQKPSWNPSMIASAISTTATKHDVHGRPIMSAGYDLHIMNPSTPFDHGAGLVDPSEALDPGLVFSSVHGDYVGFLCSIPGIDVSRVRNLTGVPCNSSSLRSPADLNLPSITVSALKGSLSIRRQVMSVGDQTETYLSSVLPPRGVRVDIQPTWFTIVPNCTQDLQITLTAVEASPKFVFGEVILTGSLDHIVRLPLSVLPVAVTTGV